MTSGQNANLTSTVVGTVIILAAMLFLTARAIAADAPEQFKVWDKSARADKYMGDPGLDTPGKTDVIEYFRCAPPVDKRRPARRGAVLTSRSN